MLPSTTLFPDFSSAQSHKGGFYDDFEQAWQFFKIANQIRRQFGVDGEFKSSSKKFSFWKDAFHETFFSTTISDRQMVVVP